MSTAIQTTSFRAPISIPTVDDINAMKKNPNIKALVVPQPVLPERHIYEVCEDFVDGFCKDKNCNASHDVHRIIGQTSTGTPERQPRMNTVTTFDKRELQLEKTNVCFLNLETMSKKKTGFEKEPGSPRHDNDGLKIQEIKIYPTADEVSPSPLRYQNEALRYF